MYTVTVCILCATAVVAVASVVFAVAVITVTISHSVKCASSALRTAWRDRIPISLSGGRFLPGLAARRAR